MRILIDECLPRELTAALVGHDVSTVPVIGKPLCRWSRLWQSCTMLDRSIMRTIEAVINEEGQIQLLESIEGGRRRRAIVVVLDEPAAVFEETAVLSEEALDDWNRPEEDSAWSYLQPAK